jgi:hypothetical protein
MAIPTGIRPRNDHERRRMHHLLHDAPRVVGIGAHDDGWLAACLWVSGRVPVWCNPTSPALAEALLARLGLPPLGQGTPEAIIDASLKLDRTCVPGIGPLPPPPPGQPMVTLLICTFNRAHMIEEAIESARLQRWPREILIVNDGSNDGTTAILDGLDGVDGIRVIHKDNGGKPSALNVGIQAARGEALIVLDDDDRLAAGALHVLGHALVNTPSAGVINGDTLCFHGDTGKPKVYMPASRLPAKTSAEAVLQQVPAMPGASLIRMSTQRSAGLYDLSLIRGQDMDMYLRLSQHAEFATVPIPTFFYRAHDGLRGSAEGQWRRSETEAHEDRFMACVTPVFLERYQTTQPITDRAMGHCWGLGLHLRRLPEQARAELERWPPPHSAREIWMRDQVGVSSTPSQATSSLLVIDDGDPGALEATLEQHAHGHELWINLEVPRDPLGNIRLYWQGEYAARARLNRWFKGPGPTHIRLSSAPDWAPPPLMGPVSSAWFPDLDAVDAVLAIAAIKGWPMPVRDRHGARSPIHPHVLSLCSVRTLLDTDQADRALTALLPVLKAMPSWPGVWLLAGEAYQRRGEPDKAKAWFARVEGLAAAG